MGVLGIDVGGTNIRVGLVEDGGLVRTESLKIKNDSSETEIIDDLNSLIGKFENEKIDGIGIGVGDIAVSVFDTNAHRLRAAGKRPCPGAEIASDRRRLAPRAGSGADRAVGVGAEPVG